MTMVKLGEVGMVCMEWYQQKWAHHLPVVLVKKCCFVFKNVLKSQKEILNLNWSGFELNSAVISFVPSPVPN